jgi:hypothetical protein
MAIDLRTAVIGSPEWYLRRLLWALEARRPRLQRLDDYYHGDQPLAFFSKDFREAFGGRFHRFSSNFMALVVDGTRERLEVTGFRFSDATGDKDLWAIWQENDLDGASQVAHTEALIKEVAYALVEPNGDGTPRITIEDPLDCVVELDPRDRRRRLAALKRWVDDEGHLVVYVYLPEFIWKYRSIKAWPERVEGWPALSMTSDSEIPAGGFEELIVTGEEWPLANPLNSVPVVPLMNRPRLKGSGQSEIDPVSSNQDVINYYQAAAVIAAEYVAYPQRYGINLELDDEARAKLRAGVGRLWTFPKPDPEDPNQDPPQLGQFEAADLSGYFKAIEHQIGAIASISRMPYHYLLGQPTSIPPSGESIKSSEAGLVAKVGTAQIHFGEGWEETMRLALRALRDERAAMRTARTLWRDPETHNEAAQTDSIIKLIDAGVIDEELAQEMAGLTPDQIERMRLRKAAAAEPVQTTA